MSIELALAIPATEVLVCLLSNYRTSSPPLPHKLCFLCISDQEHFSHETLGYHVQTFFKLFASLTQSVQHILAFISTYLFTCGSFLKDIGPCIDKMNVICPIIVSPDS